MTGKLNTMNLDECFAYVDKNADNFVQILQSLIRIPSISSDPNAPVRECGDELVKIMTQRRFNVSMIDLEGDCPLVYGTSQSAPSKNTLIAYGHYDVKPAGPLDKWRVDPFAAEILDDILIARGSCDNKGGVLSHVFAVEAILKTQGELPINLICVFDGEEEIGSPHLESWVDANNSLLAGDALYNMDKWGYSTLSVARIGSREPPVTPEINERFLHLVAKAAKNAYGIEPAFNEWTADTLFGYGLMKQIPAIMTGFGVKEHNIHQPNEQLPIEAFIKGIKYVIAIFDAFKEWKP